MTGDRRTSLERGSLERGPGPLRERLYELLPAFLRYRDQSEPLESPLRALMAVLERQHAALERDIQGLYDDWFIETCQDWLAPYLGDLLGVQGLDRPEAWLPGQRTRIANALSYRRLKGTTTVLERVARDVTGWPCVATPFFDKLSSSQSLEHLRPRQGRTVDLREHAALARAGGPFDPLARRPQISGAGGLEPAVNPRAGYNLPNLGLYFWRLQSYPVRRRSARKVSAGCYTFHPLGIDQPLLDNPGSAGDLPAAATEREVPGLLRGDLLAESLAALRRGEAAGRDYFGSRPPFEITDPRTGAPVPWGAIEIADLGAWHRPREGGERVVVAVDPELGRLAFAADLEVAGEVEVNCHCAFPGDIGGGPYSRTAVATRAAVSGSVAVGSLPASHAGTGPIAPARDSDARFRTLLEALKARPSDGSPAVIQLVDSATYGGSRDLYLEIELRAGDTLAIVAAPGETPCFIGDLRVVVGPGERPARLTLDGLTVGGKIVLAAAGGAAVGDAHRCALDIRHCTLTAPDVALGRRSVPAAGAIEVESTPGARLELTVDVRSSILGPVAIPAGSGRLAISDSVVDGGRNGGDAPPAISGAIASMMRACPAELTRCTIFGPVAVAELVARDTIFVDPVAVRASDLARARHCYVPTGSTVARLERCQPAVVEADGDSLSPVFMSRRYGQPGYARLAARCPAEIRSGATNGSEIGAFSGLGNPFREANLAGILEEYLPWGLEPRVFHVT